MMRTKTLKSRIKLTEGALVKLKERYERKSRELLAMKKELQHAKEFFSNVVFQCLAYVMVLS